MYFYNARYYDPTIGRFISADTVVPSFINPQSLNRYSYCVNNPLKYTDTTGHDPYWDAIAAAQKVYIASTTVTISFSYTISVYSNYPVINVPSQQPKEINGLIQSIPWGWVALYNIATSPFPTKMKVSDVTIGGSVTVDYGGLNKVSIDMTISGSAIPTKATYRNADTLSFQERLYKNAFRDDSPRINPIGFTNNTQGRIMLQQNDNVYLAKDLTQGYSGSICMPNDIIPLSVDLKFKSTLGNIPDIWLERDEIKIYIPNRKVT